MEEHKMGGPISSTESKHMISAQPYSTSWDILSIRLRPHIFAMDRCLIKGSSTLRAKWGFVSVDTKARKQAANTHLVWWVHPFRGSGLLKKAAYAQPFSFHIFKRQDTDRSTNRKGFRILHQNTCRQRSLPMFPYPPSAVHPDSD